jgi:hypothetical protein
LDIYTARAARNFFLGKKNLILFLLFF